MATAAGGEAMPPTGGTAAAPAAAAVEVTNLGKRFGAVEAVRGISLTVRAGEVHGLLGPNGAGKSTTLAMLATLTRPSTGEAHIFGRRLSSEIHAVRALIGIVPQEISIYPQLTARENLAFFGRVYGVAEPRRRQRAAELLEVLGLSGRADDRAATYSGGMKRRLNLACGLMHRPRLVLLDEPTAGVDPQARNHLLGVVRAIAADGAAVLYTTHYMEEAEQVCDRIAIMDEGRIVADGTLQELLGIVGMGKTIEMHGAVAAVDPARWRTIPGVTRVEVDAGSVRLSVADVGRALGPIAAIVGEHGVNRLEIRSVNLEEVFMHLTGKALRD